MCRMSTIVQVLVVGLVWSTLVESPTYRKLNPQEGSIQNSIATLTLNRTILCYACTSVAREQT